MKIQRRIRKVSVKGDEYFKTVTENVTLVKQNDRSVRVMLHNGDIITRKSRDVIGA